MYPVKRIVEVGTEEGEDVLWVGLRTEDQPEGGGGQGKPIIFGKSEVFLDRSHAQILDALHENDMRYNLEGGSVPDILEKAFNLGISIQAEITGKKVATLEELTAFYKKKMDKKD